LIAWQKAMDLVVAVYGVTGKFPSNEQFGLTSQLRRAVVSIPANIAEGEGRRSSGDFGRFLMIAYGSLREVETQLLIANRLSYLPKEVVDQLLETTAEIGRLINGLKRSLK